MNIKWWENFFLACARRARDVMNDADCERLIIPVSGDSIIAEIDRPIKLSSGVDSNTEKRSPWRFRNREFTVRPRFLEILTRDIGGAYTRRRAALIAADNEKVG